MGELGRLEGERELWNAKEAKLLAYVVLHLNVAAKAGAGCDKANRAGTKVHKM